MKVGITGRIMGKTRKYTEAELETIRSEYPGIGAIGVASKIGRSADSVKFKAHQMKIAVTPQYRSETATRVNIDRPRASSETRKRIGDGHRKHEAFVCEECGKKISHYTKRCWSCYSRGRRDTVSTSATARRMLYTAWVIPIMARDEFMCQACGSSRDLVVHHLRLFRDIMKAASAGQRAETPDERLEIARLVVALHSLDDGITLCRACHKKAHGKKRGELLGSPTAIGEDNQQPSQPNVISIVGWKVQRLTLEDSRSDKSDTSAPLAIKAMMI